MRVLIVDDEPQMRAMIADLLDMERIANFAVGSVDDAYAVLQRRDPAFDVVLLDISMPGKDGWNLLERIVAEEIDVATIFVTSIDSKESCVRGLSMGADDYVCKPFHSAELIARLSAVARRRKHSPVTEWGELRLEPLTRTVVFGDSRAELSAREFDVLSVLVFAGGEVVSKVDLLREVWGMEFDPGTTVVEVLINRLRRKIPGEYIETVRGRGYRARKRSRRSEASAHNAERNRPA